MTNLKIILTGLIALIFVIVISVWYHYTQVFVQDTSSTATKGIFFKKTLKLDAYKNISSGNDIWGTYDRYSRSDRHTEAITVYCREYCKEK